MSTDERVLRSRVMDLHSALSRLESVLVAFSGGADSAFLLVAATRALGADKVVAATAVSSSLPGTELEAARRFARSLGVAHVSPATNEAARPGYAENGRDRCFHCKAELLSVLSPLAAERELSVVATGTNADDVRDRFRPGVRAARNAGAIAPLADAGLTKAQVRAASREWGLETADKPAAACLSSRVAYGVQITSSRLARIERAESRLRQVMLDSGIPVRNLRVRDLGGRARVEVDADCVPGLLARPDLLVTVEGFDSVEVDPSGFRSGSMNDLR